jgi:AcrR family transcriptional regulator
MNKKRLEDFHKSNILKAADCLFREFGYQETTVDKIARLADYSKTTVYSYFPSKEEIFFNIIYSHVKILEKDFNAVIKAGGKFEAAFMQLCGVLVKMEAEKPVYFEGMIGNINMHLERSDTPKVYRDIFMLGNAIKTSLCGVVERGVEEGLIPENAEKEKLVLYLWSSITGIIRMTKQKSDYFLLNNITREDMLDYCFHNVLYGITIKQK